MIRMVRNRQWASAVLPAAVSCAITAIAGCSAAAPSDTPSSAGGTRPSGGSGGPANDGGGGVGGRVGAAGATTGSSGATGASNGQGGLAAMAGMSNRGSGGLATNGGRGGSAGTGATEGGSSGSGDSAAGSSGIGGSTPATTTVGCGRPREQVSVGGVEGFASFADPTHSARLRACGASLYIHQVGWGGITDDQRREIATNFAGTGGVSLEMAEATDLQADYFGFGITSIGEILVNAPTCEVPEADMAVDVWQGWVTRWKGLGIGRAEYNDTPNCHFPVNWNDGKWDASKERARIGGGVILDSPPYFYYYVGPDDYRVFVRAEIAWANANGLHSSWILSPGGDRDFLTATQQLVAEVNALPPNQRPQQWIVESYGAGGPVGDENVPGNVANVALWVVNNAQVYQP